MVSVLLSIDLDFFVTPRPMLAAPATARLPEEDGQLVAEPAALGFLAQRCHLEPSSPRPGAVIRDHDEIVSVVEYCLEEQLLVAPLDLVHLDAHADMGMSRSGTAWTACVEVLHKIPRILVEDRARCRDNLDMGNWLVYLAAFGWLRRVTHLKWSGHHDDLHHLYFRGGVARPGLPIEIVPINDPANYFFNAENRERDTRRSIVPPIPLDLPTRSEFKMARAPDVVVLAQSPRYTPESADALFLRLSDLLSPLQGREVRWPGVRGT